MRRLVSQPSKTLSLNQSNGSGVPANRSWKGGGGLFGGVFERVEPCTLLIKGQWNLFTSSDLNIEKVRMEKDIRKIGRNRHILNYIFCFRNTP
jgi:hypothetical protein